MDKSVDTNYASYIQAIPDEILVKILQYCSIRNMSSLCASCKGINNIIDWNMKRDMAGSYMMERAKRPKEARKIKKRWTEGLIKAAIDLDSPNHLDYYIKLNYAEKGLNGAIRELIPATNQDCHSYKTNSKTAPRIPITEQFIDNMISKGLVNLQQYFVKEWEGLWPDIRRRKHSQSFQLYWMRQLYALYTNYNASTTSFQRLLPLVLEQLEIYSDMLIRLLVSDIHVMYVGSSRPNETIELILILIHPKFVYLEFLNKLRTESNLKIDFINPSPHCIEEKDISLQIGFQKLMMLKPIEASFLCGVSNDQMMKIVPIESYGAVLAATFCRLNPPDSDVPQLIERGADVNALLPKTFSKFLGSDPNIESALGASVFITRYQRHWRIEWLLSNGAKFSELEKEFVLNKGTPMLKKILSTTLQPRYNLLLNEYNDHPIAKLTSVSTFYSPEGRISFTSGNNFCYHKNPRKEYIGKFSFVRSKIICVAVEEVVEVYRNSYSSAREKQPCSKVFNFIVHKTAFDGVAFRRLEDWETLPDSGSPKSYLPFFGMYWDFNFNK